MHSKPDYKAIFLSPPGQDVLRDLSERVGLLEFSPAMSEREAGFYDGRKSVIAEIVHLVYGREQKPIDPILAIKGLKQW